MLGAVRTYAPLVQRLVHTAMALASLYRCTDKHDCTRFAMVLVLRCMLKLCRGGISLRSQTWCIVIAEAIQQFKRKPLQSHCNRAARLAKSSSHCQLPISICSLCAYAPCILEGTASVKYAICPLKTTARQAAFAWTVARVVGFGEIT